jgi:hypothetical protein
MHRVRKDWVSLLLLSPQTEKLPVLRHSSTFSNGYPIAVKRFSEAAGGE